jgi:hypothetical protein
MGSKPQEAMIGTRKVGFKLKIHDESGRSCRAKADARLTVNSEYLVAVQEHWALHSQLKEHYGHNHKTGRKI